MDQPAAEQEAGLTRALEHLQSVLVSGETLEAWAVQRRAYALKHRRLLLAATSGRLISIARGLFGGFELSDFRWQDLQEVKLKVGIFAADLTVRVGSGADLASAEGGGGRILEFQGLRKGQAEAVYRICQGQDQAWREKRRVRDLEELRARAGGIQLGGVAGTAGPSGADVMQRLQQAKQMLDSKLITDAEFESIKAKLLASG